MGLMEATIHDIPEELGWIQVWGLLGGLVNSIIRAQDGIREEGEILLSVSDLNLRFAALVSSSAGVAMQLPVWPLYPLVPLL